MDLPQRYDPKVSEAKWQKYWEKNGIFKFDEKSDAEVYSVDTPPPTVSGKMHIGHAFSYSQQDFVIRYKRMKGFNVFYPFGTDDNGLATERLIEKTKNVRSKIMERKEFVKLCLDTLAEIRPKYVADWKRLGISCDFDLFYTTINEHSQKISQKSFLDLYKKDRIVKKKSPIMFCPTCQTAIAQVEMKDTERESHLVHIKAKAVDSGEEIVFATTRPELIWGCVGISVHPDDKRYSHLIGKQIMLPVINKSVEMIPDEFTDMEYGTGVVYYCTYGGVECIDWMERHPKVKAIDVMGLDGKYNENAGFCKGLKSNEARKKVIEELEKENALVKLEKIKHIVNTHERCDTDIEYVATEQWYIKYLDLKEDFLKAGQEMNWYPEFMRTRYDNWIKGLRWDWNISRQRYFGVPFPLWYTKDGKVILADESQLPIDPLTDKPKNLPAGVKAEDLIPESDVMDTWATSSMTPQLAVQLVKDEKVRKKLFPMSLRPQAHDIITFWLFNTVVKSRMHYGVNPWKDIIISGFALDPHGRKMSKSKGNAVEPQPMIEKYSADSLRFWAAGSKLGDDLPFMEKELVSGQKFTTKLWNASKFAIISLEDYDGKQKPKQFYPADKYFLSLLNTLVKNATESFENYEYVRTKLETEKFFWHMFCDNYLEIVKDRFYNKDSYTEDEVLSAKYTLYTALLTILKLMAPITPHITEEIYHIYFAGKEGRASIHASTWPGYDESLINGEAEEAGANVIDIITSIRKFKSENSMPLNSDLSLIEIECEDAMKQKFEPMLRDIKATCKVKKITFGKGTIGANDKVKISIQK